jgi:hypothetical protein
LLSDQCVEAGIRFGVDPTKFSRRIDMFRFMNTVPRTVVVGSTVKESCVLISMCSDSFIGERNPWTEREVVLGAVKRVRVRVRVRPGLQMCMGCGGCACTCL